MSDNIELVIKIPEKTYKHILSMQFYIPGSRSDKLLLEEILKAIRTGTPLPKGHGDLIDRKDLTPDADYEDGIFGAVSCQQIVEAEAIIEADTESENKE